VGRIRIGEQIEGERADGSTYTRPAKLDKFRLTSASKPVLDQLARVYGGVVEKWEDAPTGNQFELVTETDTLSVLVPPEGMALTQWYEIWSGGGCRVRCDGQWDVINDQSCSCSKDPEERLCKPHTRLTMMIEEVAAQGMWRLDTQGYYAATELGGAFELATLLQEGTGRRLLRGVLRLDQREVKKPDQPTRKFAVPVLTFDMPSSGLTPVPSLGEAIRELDDAAPAERKANAAPPVADTGLKPQPRTVDDAREALATSLAALTPAQKAEVKFQWQQQRLPAIDKIADLLDVEAAEDIVAGVRGDPVS
jgi:hypothetical protein